MICRNSGSALVAALQQHQIDPHPHAAHPHDLAHDVDDGEPVEQVPPVLRQGQPVGPRGPSTDECGLLGRRQIVTRIGGSSVIRGRPSAIVR